MSSKQQRGYVIPIGGAEEKEHDPRILRRFAELCGGGRASIAVIPTASSVKTTGAQYEQIFQELCGVKDVRILPFRERRDADNEEWLKALREVDGVFVTGGNQMRLAAILGGTEVARILRQRNAREGLHVAGTSAGAAFVSEHMIAGGEEGHTPHEGMVTLATGLGVTTKLIIDQHFRQRERLGRLLVAIAANPQAVGIGLDEDTAAFIGPDDELEIVGSGAATILDPSEMEYTSIDLAPRHAPVAIVNLRLHVLTDGGRYNVTTRRARLGVPCSEGSDG